MAEFKATADNFEQEVILAAEPVLVDFWAVWCGPCKMEGKAIEALLLRKPELKVAKINVDEEGDLAEEYGITAIPTLMLFENGEIKKQSVGYLSPEELEAFIG